MSALKEVVEVTDKGTDRERYVWAVVGDKGAVHVWAQTIPQSTYESNRGLWSYPFYGGIEVHKLKPDDYDSSEPSQDNCWLLDAPCWHDGSSLYFSNHISPILSGVGLETPAATQYALSVAASWYRSHFEGSE